MPKTGRPSKPVDQVRSEVVRLRLTAPERVVVARLAGQRAQNVTQVVRAGLHALLVKHP